MDEEQALYEFPGWNEEHTVSDIFLAVSAIAFEDYNDDGLLDVITLCEYETMSGQGFQTARIYFQMKDKQGFEEDTLLTEYLTKNYHTDSIASILNAKEDYWDYLSAMDGHRSVYNQMLVMAENKDIWLAAPDYAYDGLTECETDFAEGDSQPDIISDRLETYMDDQGQFHYAVYDLAKNGAGEYYENIRELVLKEGQITLVPIAYRTTIYQDGTHMITCEDSEGNAISEEDFENASKTYFTGY